MTNWQQRLSIKDILKKYDPDSKDSLSVSEVAHQMADYLRNNTHVRNYYNRSNFGVLIKKLETFNEDIYDGYELEVFDGIMSDIYDIADDEAIWMGAM